MDSVNIQLKNINVLLNNINEDIQKNNEKIKNLCLNINKNELEIKNKIKGELYIEENEINKNIVLFHHEDNIGVEVYLNNMKKNIIKNDNEWKYNFTKKGKYSFKLIFKDKMTNYEGFFEIFSDYFIRFIRFYHFKYHKYITHV